MKRPRRPNRKPLSILLVLCMVLTLVPVTAFAAGDENEGGSGGNIYTHTYHTKIEATANVTIKDADGNVTETTTVTKDDGAFIKGNVSDEAVQDEIKRVCDEIDDSFASRGNVTVENYSGQLIFDHFESNNILDEDNKDSEGANENSESGRKHLDVHEYQIYQITYDLIVQEEKSGDTVITKVDIGNIWKTLDASQTVPFTAEVNPNSECAEQMEIIDECWSSKSTTNGHTTQTIRKSDETQQKPIADEIYSYGVTLRAKDGYVFDETQTPVFICEGKTCTAAYIPSPSTDYKQAYIFFQGITATAIDSSKPAGEVIDAVDISNVKFDYQAGDTPQATAGRGGESASEYEIEYEYWEEMIEHSGTMLPVKYWYSDEEKNNALKPDQKITTFEEGKTYMYSISLKAKDGNTFAANCPVTVNGSTVRDANVTNMGTGLFVTAVKTIKPKAPGMAPEYKVIEGANGTWKQNSDGTLTFRANGEFSKFTGVKVDDQLVDAKNYTAVSGSTIVTLSADYLKTLSTGNHTLTVVFNDGDCSTNFTVQAAGLPTTPSNPGSGTGSGTTPSNPNGGTSGSATTPSGSNGTTGSGTTAGGTKATGTNTGNLDKAPKTGEDSPLALWIGVLCVSAFGMVGTTVYTRKKKYSK